jgi:hypothetical protein
MSELRVVCRAGDGRPELPVRFGTGEALREIVEIEDSWPGEGYRYFRVLTADGGRFVLRHDERLDRWSLHSFQSRPSQPGGA